jgi:hypothetical protein
MNTYLKHAFQELAAAQSMQRAFFMIADNAARNVYYRSPFVD